MENDVNFNKDLQLIANVRQSSESDKTALEDEYYRKSKVLNEPHNIDGNSFKPQEYLTKLLKEKDLSDLIAKEIEIVEQIKSLDAEMQTLVYENYSKFIFATDTIKMMKTDFKYIETEMNNLASKVNDITNSGNSINSVLNTKRNEINSLAETKKSLEKLQYLFNLPKNVRHCIKSKNWVDGVKFFKNSKNILALYEELPSFRGIKDDYEEVKNEFLVEIRNQFDECTKYGSHDYLIEALGVIFNSLIQLASNLKVICKSVISTDAYINMKKLLDQEIYSKSFQLVELQAKRLQTFLFQAIQLKSVNKFNAVEVCLRKYVKDAHSAPLPERNSEDEDVLMMNLDSTHGVLTNELKQNLMTLQKFMNTNENYAMNAEFYVDFHIDICREGFIVKYFNFLASLAESMCETKEEAISTEMLVLCARLFYNWSESGLIGKMLAIVDDSILPKASSSYRNRLSDTDLSDLRKTVQKLCSQRAKDITVSGRLSEKFSSVSQALISAAVYQEGLQKGSMLQKSVEARNWFIVLEPRSVRTVIKKFYENVKYLYHLLYEIFPDEKGNKKPRQGNRSATDLSVLSNNSTDHHLRQLFTQKVEVYDKVQFSLDGFIMGILKIAIKGFIESVRMHIFSNNGLNQIQIDAFYLKQHLKEFVSENATLNQMLDDLVFSVSQRSTEQNFLDLSALERLSVH